MRWIMDPEADALDTDSISDSDLESVTGGEEEGWSPDVASP